MSRPTTSGLRAGVDWARIRERIDALGRTIAGEDRISPEEARAVLRERARALAAPPPSASAGESLELLVLEVDAERYAIESRFVVEVFRLGEVAVIPGAAPPVRGLTAWRGELLTLLDLRQMLGLSAATGGDPHQVVVVGEARASFGIPVEAVEELRAIPASAIRPLTGEARSGRGFLRGTTSDAVLVLSALDLIRAHT